MGLDKQGNVYIAGYFDTKQTIGTSTVTPVGNRDFLWLKLNASGEPQWAFSAGGADDDALQALEVDSNGDLIVAGVYNTDGFSIDGHLLPAGGQSNIAVAKFDPNGTARWVRGYASTSNEDVTKVALDADGNIVFAGTITGEMDFGDARRKPAGIQDGYVVKLNPNGDTLFTFVLGSASVAAANGVTVDKRDNSIYVAGLYQGTMTIASDTMHTTGQLDGLVAKYTSAGKALWGKAFDSTGIARANQLVNDSLGNVFVTGGFDTAVTLGKTSLTSTGNLDMLLAKFDSSGTPLWAVPHGNANLQELGAPIKVNAANDVMVGEIGTDGQHFISTLLLYGGGN